MFDPEQEEEENTLERIHRLPVPVVGGRRTSLRVIPLFLARLRSSSATDRSRVQFDSHKLTRRKVKVSQQKNASPTRASDTSSNNIPTLALVLAPTRTVSNVKRRREEKSR